MSLLKFNIFVVSSKYSCYSKNSESQKIISKPCNYENGRLVT